MFEVNSDTSLLQNAKNEQFPDLVPLLRFLTKSPIIPSSTLDCIHEALESSLSPELMKCYIHGVMWESLTNDDVSESDDDVFSSRESCTIPFEAYSAVVTHFHLESFALRSFCLMPSFREQLICIYEQTENCDSLLMKLLEAKNPVELISDLELCADKELESWFLGSALAHVAVLSDTVPRFTHSPVLEDIVLYLISLPTISIFPNGLLEVYIGVLVSLLGHLDEAEVQLRMLRRLQHFPDYHTVLDCLAESVKFVALADQIVITTTNQIMELKSVQDGVLTDEREEQEHLQKFINEIYPCLVLFPKTVTSQLVSNALLYDAQQRLITRILDFYSPVFVHEEQDLIMEALRETTMKMNNLPPQNISTFVQYCMKSNIQRQDYLLVEICIPCFKTMVQPVSTIEGLLESCLQILSAGKMNPVLVLRFFQRMFAVIQMFCFPGYSSEPNWETFVLLLDALSSQCVHSIVEAKQDFSEPEINQFCTAYLELDWKMRILFSPVLLNLSCDEDLTTLFSPEDLTAYDEAHLWIYRITEFLLLVSVHQEYPLHQLQDHLNEIKELLVMLPEELISWSIVMALVNLTSVLFPSILDRILQKAVPVLLRCVFPDEKENENLVIEIFCRALFVIGSNPEFTEFVKFNVVKTGTFQMMKLCTELSPDDPQSKEIFILRSFQEAANLMTSMETGSQFETSNLQILLINLIQQLTELSSKTSDGFILPSGVALKLVLQWLFSMLVNLRTESRSSIILATDRIIKTKLIEL